ncbi:unnamed protein product [Taenia asiatica]|uniref:SCP domain-containing protein n=1 Tax=Taenia asiatica TaxID=60517 RepID=A0A0R3VYT9_TAEAS|nr:unnamed protein product [Taenia asiatica]
MRLAIGFLFLLLADVFVRACCLTVLLSAAACWRPTNVDRARVLELHHRTREDVIPTAGNMRLLMISSHASEVGCAIGKRNDAVPGWPNPQYVTVCAYRPRGNFATKRPYRSAPSCYYCRMDEYCYRNQCVKNPQFNHVYPINNLPKPEDREVPKCAVV